MCSKNAVADGKFHVKLLVGPCKDRVVDLQQHIIRFTVVDLQQHIIRFMGDLNCLRLLLHLRQHIALLPACCMSALLELPLLADLQACQVLLDSIWHLCRGIAA